MQPKKSPRVEREKRGGNRNWQYLAKPSTIPDFSLVTNSNTGMDFIAVYM